jgi:predicted RNA methylase
MVPLVGRAVVELGAGTGIVGLAAGRLGAHRVWMTDGTSLLLCCSAALLLCCSAALLLCSALLCCFAALLCVAVLLCSLLVAAAG